MLIYLIRHSMTPGNKKRCYIGSTDESLCKEGIELLARYQYPTAQMLITSPMRRCIETAEYIYPDMQSNSLVELRECDFGRFEGMNYEELKDDPVYQEWISKEGKIPFPDGEDQMMFRERCVIGFDKAVERFYKNGVKEGALVVHGGTIMAILEKYARPVEDFYHWKVDNGQGFTIEVNEVTWFGDCNDRYVVVKEKLNREEQ
ncbi:histidine phosphatase family protein [Anaerosporobacter faecicola]|uniref:histidine phosphatase family protein n=1 Tax=Anaerosporobacter faecicola TaxID=2718714 RepID=UPI00143BCE15|nr:histidine phosphatase family protein [Anaerosporobacter faecicola]